MTPTSAIPKFYYLLFGVYEPLVTVTGFLGAIADPKKVCLITYSIRFNLTNFPSLLI